MKYRSWLVDIVYLILFPLFLIRLVRDKSYRAGIGERFGYSRPPRRKGRRLVWIHAASVGEAAASRGLAKDLLARGNIDLLLTTNTPAGRERWLKDFPDTPCRYIPFDFSPVIDPFVGGLRPDAIVLIELELWPNLISAAARREIPVVVLNGRMTDKACGRYLALRWFFAPILKAISLFCAQEDQYSEKIRRFGVGKGKIVVTGNMKFDSLQRVDGRELRDRYRALLGIREGEPVIVAGSTHDPEEDILTRALIKIRGDHPSARLILAPRHLTRVEKVQKMVEAAGLTCYKRSSFADSGGDRRWDAVVLDTIGELASIYAVADAVYVGGSLVPRGGQNVMEPAFLGKPVIMGKSCYNFRDVTRSLADNGALITVDDEEGLCRELTSLLSDGSRRERMGRAGESVIIRGTGATERNIGYVCRFLKGVTL